MKHLFFLWLVLCISGISLAQTIIVKDKETNKALEFVTIYNESENTYALTNAEGQLLTETTTTTTPAGRPLAETTTKTNPAGRPLTETTSKTDLAGWQLAESTTDTKPAGQQLADTIATKPAGNY